MISKLLRITTCAVVFVVASTSARAATFLATSTTWLSLVSITSITGGNSDDVSFTTGDLTLSKQATSTGNASGNATTGGNLLTSSIFANAWIDGQADFDGRVDANSGRKAWFDFTNNSTNDSFSLNMKLSHSYVVKSNEPGPEYQHAEASGTGKLLSKNDAKVRMFSFTADSDVGPESDSNTAEQLISFSLFSGESLRLTVVSEAKGYAVASVPLPSSAFGLIVGLLLLAALRRRRV
ncbi:hypothetical protein DL239_12045 [Sedimentitalea sp. CY04]|uniref:Secreted protein n=1 Tax=Parasedimentitalea denitrificans TaxID=2211118 RepID=A0ABX0W8D9_9RHOB|nr:hypothetical protein [Sedimentitalea sp. CY04]NIZ61701.1 hypothetical protein [Sedimentitalea sp. CY04]